MDDVMKALAEPNRRNILRLVSWRELSAGEIAGHFDVTRSAVSQHLAVLRDAGLLDERRDGTRRLYRTRPEGFAAIRLMLEGFWDERLTRLQLAAETDAPAPPATERVAVERDLLIAASPQVVWDRLVSVDGVISWMGVSADLQPEPGGRYRVEVVPGEFVEGEFLVVDEPQRLCHTWGWVGEGALVPPGSTIVTYDLVEVRSSTVLGLRHEALPNAVAGGTHANGWAHYLERLRKVAEGRPPVVDPWTQDRPLMIDELGL